MGIRRLFTMVALCSLAACGGSSSSSDRSSTDAPTTTLAATTTTLPVTASANPIAQGVDAKLGAGEYVNITSPTEAVVGDHVRTDATGFAEIDYSDGSLTRLDVSTDFTIEALATSSGVATTRTKLDAGRVWNRVQKLGTEGEYTVETAVATATVRGTAFLVDCRPSPACVFTVLEGSIELALTDGSTVTLTAPESVKVDPNGAGTPTKVPYDVAFADPWVVDNTERDVTAGYSSRLDVYRALGPAFASLSGQFDGNRVVRTADCLNAPTCSDAEAVGDSQPRTYVFSTDCSSGYPCTRMTTTQYVDATNTVHEADVPVAFDGTGYSWSFDFDTFQCAFDDNGDGVYGERPTGNLHIHLEWTLTPTTADAREGAWVVTGAALTSSADKTVTDDQPVCRPVNVHDVRATYEATLLRTR